MFINSSLKLNVCFNVRPLFWESSQAHLLVVIPGLRKQASVMNGFLKYLKIWITRELLKINGWVRHQNVQLGVLSSTMYYMTGSATLVESWPEVVRFGSEVVKCGIKMFISRNWIQWCIILWGKGSGTSLDPQTRIHPAKLSNALNLGKNAMAFVPPLRLR
jgi:hypothetical protein